MFSEKSVGKHAFFLLIDRIEGKGGRYTLYNMRDMGNEVWVKRNLSILKVNR